jgi:hypothetical protein
VVAGLIASTAYFAISPVSTAHSELLARTSPTIYDVLIAFFGGLAGIIAISSKLKGNVIPGVAIATALMPPLCTAGYGLATAQFAYFFGALYLFTINTVFIALSSVAIAQLLKFPITTIVDPLQKKKVNHMITAVILITIIPSIYFGYGLVQQERFMENASRFIKSVSVLEGDYLLNHVVNTSNRTITLIYVGGDMSPEKQFIIEERAKDFSIDKDEIIVKQGFSVDKIMDKNNEFENLRIEINRLSTLLKEKDEQLKITANIPVKGKQLLSELNSLFPEVHSCTYSESTLYQKELKETVPIALISITAKRNSLTNAEKAKIEKWLKERNPSIRTEVYFKD